MRRDPKGVRGISPFWEAVNRGDAAYLTRDFEGAVAAYRDAVAAAPQDPLGHHRLGQALIAKGESAEGEQSWQAALRFAGDDQGMRAKVLYSFADLRERQGALDEAFARWEQLEKIAEQHEAARLFVAAATERKKRIEEWKKLRDDSAAVKERIDARLKEAEAAARKNVR